ncbi:carboxypeptidase regulatory-like domain-containing protein [Gracilimonas sp.]|uniref:carboxypeptidase-like regulatory domain-containing protein n=1 Tax=Gracilimonas sp. TaxID=1974203 RepID=UPI002871A80E|nr:carboxypeptidase-like regulatory domain-containing protein [Gracilimonas sp.]
MNGRITDSQTGNVIENATVQINSPEEFSDTFTRTNAEGQYTLGDIQVSSLTELSITSNANDYNPSTKTVQVAEGDNITDFDFQLEPEEVDDGNGGGGVAGPAGGAAAIVLAPGGITNESINIAETGGTVNTSFTFALQDSAGRNLDLNNAEEVEFSIISGPGGGEGITPLSAQTNSEGTVTSNLFSGNLAGVVQIQAQIEREDIGLTIRSKPVAITIHGGFPDPDHFSLSVQTFNFEGFARDGVRNQISVIVGDKFSNPVKPGTAVYFETTGGIIQGSGVGHTDADGEVSVDLISGGKRSLLNHPTLGFGYATITATTIDENNNEIQEQADVLFSAPPSTPNITLTPSTFTIPSNGGETFDLTVTDTNGNPLPAGTTVTIEVADGLEVTGGGIEIPNALVGGSGITDFTFSVADTDDENSNEQNTQITIKVETPAGDKASDSYSGTRAKWNN